MNHSSQALTIPCASVLSPTLADELAAYEAGVEQARRERRRRGWLSLEAYLAEIGLEAGAIGRRS